MSSASFGRRRIRIEPKPSSVINCGILLKRRTSDNEVLQKIPFAPAAFPFNLQQVTWDSIHKGPPFKSGGPFATIKAFSDHNAVKATGVHRSPPQSGGFYWEYNGGFIRPTTSQDTTWANTVQGVPSDPFGAGGLPSQEGIGPQVFDRLRPKLGEDGAFQFLAEIREAKTMLKTSSRLFKAEWEGMGGRSLGTTMASTPKKVSNHFLNHTFGWAPFLKDLLAIFDRIEKQREIMSQMSRDNGNWVKRGRTISTEDVTTAVRFGAGAGLPWRSEFNTMCNNLPGTSFPYQYTQVDTRKVRTWAVGRFRYYRPEFDVSRTDYVDHMMTVRRLLILHGIRINPSNLYKITPWTWLFDWFTGFGSWLSRIQSIGLDGVAAEYLYIMRESEIKTTHTVTINWKDGPQLVTWNNSLFQKQREEAGSPFGFTLPGGGLTAKQLAILVALGISR